MTREVTTTIETYTGQFVDLLDPDPDTICLEDIANHLSNLCRFNGAVSRFYSVAEHAVRVSKLVPPEAALAALHHDSHEAYMGDVTSPLKQVLEEHAPGEVAKISEALDHAIAHALRVPLARAGTWQYSAIKQADQKSLYREAAALKYSRGRGEHWGQHDYVRPYAGIGWSSEKAEREFLKRHDRLTRKR